MARSSGVAVAGTMFGGRRWKAPMGYLAVAETTHYIAHKLCSGGGYFVIGLTEKAHGSAQEKEGIEKKKKINFMLLLLLNLL